MFNQQSDMSTAIHRGEALGSMRNEGVHFEYERPSSGSRDPAASQQRHDLLRSRLRNLTRSCIDRHQLVSALFYADKLLTLSADDPYDVLLFADVCYWNRQYHRAIHVIKKHKLTQFVSIDTVEEWALSACLILGQCMLAIKQKEECLDMLSEVVPVTRSGILSLAKRFSAKKDAVKERDCVNIVASLVMLMGEAFEAIGNREQASSCFRLALECDMECAEAFIQLQSKHMLTAFEEEELLASLEERHGDESFVGGIYRAQICKYQDISTKFGQFQALEDKYAMRNNLEMSIAKAETHFHHHDIQSSYELCEWVREQDPYNYQVIPLLVANMFELQKKRELYQYAHQMVDVYPKKAVAWYTVGCYYFLVQKFEAAQRYFHKATSLEPGFAPAWIGFGNSFAAQDESDQAMSSYRTASNLFPGSHLPSLYIGMEHVRTNNLAQAIEFIKQAQRICAHDPLVYNELGAVYYRQKKYEEAIEMFTKVLDLCKDLPERLMERWEATLFNLGYAYRKTGKYDNAKRYFEAARRLNPRNASVHAALGFTFHMMGHLDHAIESYHTALAFNPEEALAGEMITVAFNESLESIHIGPEVRQAKSQPVPIESQEASRLGTSLVDSNVKRTLRMDQSFSSIERSQRSMMSSIDFSDESSMNLDE